jgi:two-component system, cell cycle sensor histidine kinase and response regulator CckA
MGKPSGRILIVDDEPRLLRMIHIYLERQGYSLETFGRTEDAWAAFQTDPGAYSAALLDATIPGMPADQFAELALRTNPALRVIMASGYLMDISAVEQIAPGRVVFLQKPFGPEMLAGILRRMLGEQEEEDV